MSVFDVCTNSTFLLAVVCAVLFFMYDYWERLYFKRKGIPGPWPLPFIGTLLSMKGFNEDLAVKQKKYGKVFGINIKNNIFVISDIEILQEIMIKKFSVFPNRAAATMNKKPFDKALNMARDDHWKSVRNKLTPAFTGNKMKQMESIINDTCDQLLASFENHRNSDGGIQCRDLFGAYSMDVVASVFFGIEVDSIGNPNDPFVQHAKATIKQFRITSPKVFAAYFIPGASIIMNYFDISIFNPSLTKFFTDVISHTLELRERGDIKRVDVLQLMADAHKLDSDDEETGDTSARPKDPKKALLTDEIMANALIFLLAGYETTNTALCFISYLLATNPDYQERLTKEVDDLVPTRDDLTYEILSKMEYLDCFVKEALRMYPPAAIIDRDNNEDIAIKDFFIPKGTRIFIPIYAIHHDPDVWEEPEVFNPERFNKENRIRPCSWLPFGDGPRNCIGMRLAMMEMKFAVIRLLQVYKLDTCAETEIPPVLNKKSAFISPPNGIKLSVVPRKKTE